MKKPMIFFFYNSITKTHPLVFPRGTYGESGLSGQLLVKV